MERVRFALTVTAFVMIVRFTLDNHKHEQVARLVDNSAAARSFKELLDCHALYSQLESTVRFTATERCVEVDRNSASAKGADA